MTMMRKILLMLPVFFLLEPIMESAQNLGGRPEGTPEFVFTRLIYRGPYGGRGFRGSSWATDYPEADWKFMWGVQRLTNLRIQMEEHAIETMDPRLFRYPFLYVVEPGRGMTFSDTEAKQLREYVDRGGFIVFDDFWGTYQWQTFAAQLRRVFPDREVEEIPRDHEIWHCFYDIDAFMQVPNISNGIRGYQTHEQDGYVPYLLGIFDEKRRLNVVISFNSDLGDAWEWMDHPQYPEKFSGYAYRIGINFIIYAMTH